MPLEAKLTQATAAHAVATEADTVAQNANTAARSRAAMVMGALGGVTGLLTIGVTALAAGYMYMKSKSDEVNDSFSTQIGKVDELAKKYRELNTAKLVQEQELVNQKLKDFTVENNKAIAAVGNLAGVNDKAVGKQKKQIDLMNSISKGLRDGVLTTGLAMEKMVNSGLFSEKQIANATKYFAQFNDSKAGITEMKQQLSFISKETGLFGNEADKTAKKLNNQKIIVNALTESYESSNKELKNSIDWLLQQDSSLKASESQFKTVNKAVENYNKGTLTASELAKVLRENLPVESSTISSIESLATKTANAKNELEKHNKEVDKLPKTAEAGERAFKLLEQGADEAKVAVAGLGAEFEKLNKTQNERQYDAIYINSLLKKGFSEQQAKDLLEVQKAVGLGVALKKENLVQLKETWKAVDVLQKTQDQILEKEQQKTKALKEQNKEREKGNRLVGLVGSTGSSTGNHLHIQYPSGSNKGAVTPEHLARFQMGGKTLSTKNQGSPYGEKRKKGPHGGIDFPAPAGTPITTNVGVKSITKHIQKEGGKVVGGGYYSRVTFEDGVVIDLMHQIPEMMTKIKGGASKGNATKSANDAYDSFLDDQKEVEQLQKERNETAIKLLYENSGRIEQIEADKQQRIKDIKFASLADKSVEQAMLDDAENRAKVEKELYREQLNYEMNEFQASEEWKLEQSHKIKKLQINLDKNLDSNARDLRLKALEAEHKENSKMLSLATQKRIFEVKQQFMSETEAMKERYRLEHEEFLSIAEPAERNLAIQGANHRQGMDENAKREGLWGEYQNMTGIDSVSPYQRDADLLRAVHAEMLISEEEYQKQRLILQGKYGGQYGAEFAGIMMGLVDSSSSAYALLGTAQKMFTLYSVGLSSIDAISKAWASAPFPANLGAVGIATMKTGLLQAAVSALSPQGFATGGLIRGAGTGTSDSIPIMASNQEFMIKASSVSKIGQANLDYMNKYGELPQQTQRVGQNTLNALSNSEARQAERSKASSVQQAPQVNVNPQIVITDERQSIADFMSSRSGEQIIMKTLKRNGIAK